MIEYRIRRETEAKIRRKKTIRVVFVKEVEIDRSKESREHRERETIVSKQCKVVRRGRMEESKCKCWFKARGI